MRNFYTVYMIRIALILIICLTFLPTSFGQSNQKMYVIMLIDYKEPLVGCKEDEANMKKLMTEIDNSMDNLQVIIKVFDAATKTESDLFREIDNIRDAI